MWTDGSPFERSAFPQSVEEYGAFMQKELEFVEKRNRRIHEAVISTPSTLEKIDHFFKRESMSITCELQHMSEEGATKWDNYFQRSDLTKEEIDEGLRLQQKENDEYVRYSGKRHSELFQKYLIIDEPDSYSEAYD